VRLLAGADVEHAPVDDRLVALLIDVTLAAAGLLIVAEPPTTCRRRSRRSRASSGISAVESAADCGALHPVSVKLCAKDQERTPGR
jgi:hypothetical protein